MLRRVCEWYRFLEREHCLIYGMVFLLPGDGALASDRSVGGLAAFTRTLRSSYIYLRYLGGILHGDTGRAYSELPVSAVLAPCVSGHHQAG